MVWSAASIPGAPALLVVDASDGREGWEADFCRRLAGSLGRRGLNVAVAPPTERPADLRAHLAGSPPPNCVLLAGHATPSAPGSGLRECWEWLQAQEGLPPMLVALCTWGDHDPDLSREVLHDSTSLAPFALAPTSPLTPREAGLYFLKFFTELHLHAPEEISGRMVWFSASKAAALLRRRGLAGTVGVRC